jgi:hypothetical protein
MEQCRLCLQTVSNLRSSHYLSKGIYRILRDIQEKNPNPWVITSAAAFQTSRQMMAYLLCGDCEQKLSKNGENYVLANCLQRDRRFPLAELLAGQKPDVWSRKTSTRIYCASAIPEVNISALAYFAVSIFWRGSVYPWSKNDTVRLGPFQEQFRLYLLGLAPFPKDCCLWAMIREKSEIDRLTYSPIGERKGNVHVYKFPMPGLAFSLMVSKNIPAHLKGYCLMHGFGNPIIVTSLVEEFLSAEAANLRTKRSVAVGSRN